MQKIRKNPTKHIAVALDFSPQQLAFSFNPKKIPLQLGAKNSPQSYKFKTNGRRTDQKQRQNQSGIIRLGSKKKLIRTQSKQNTSLTGSRFHKQDCKAEKQRTLKESLKKQLKTQTQSKSKLQVKKLQISCFNDSTKKRERVKTQSNMESVVFNFEKITIQDSLLKYSKNQKSKQKNDRKMSQCKSLSNFMSKKQSRVGRSCSLNRKASCQALKIDKKMQQRIDKVKKYKFIKQYLTDLELEGIFNELLIAEVPECRWPLIIIDRVYEIMKQRQSNDYSGEVIRKF